MRTVAVIVREKVRQGQQMSFGGCRPDDPQPVLRWNILAPPPLANCHGKLADGVRHLGCIVVPDGVDRC